jgi:hypothetical protein
MKSGKFDALSFDNDIEWEGDGARIKWEACEVCEPTKRRRAGPGRRECMIREDVLSSERSVPFDERDGECEWDCIVG